MIKSHNIHQHKNIIDDMMFGYDIDGQITKRYTKLTHIISKRSIWTWRTTCRHPWPTGSTKKSASSTAGCLKKQTYRFYPMHSHTYTSDDIHLYYCICLKCGRNLVIFHGFSEIVGSAHLEPSKNHNPGCIILTYLNRSQDWWLGLSTKGY